MNKARIHILMPFTLKKRMKKAIPLGLRSDFSRCAIEMAIEAIEEHGPAFLGLMLTGEVVFRPNPKKEGIYETHYTAKQMGGDTVVVGEKDQEDGQNLTTLDAK